MIHEELTEEVARQYALDMLETGSTFAEIGAYLQGKGLDAQVIDRIIASAAEAPLQKRMKQRMVLAGVCLIVGLSFIGFAFYLQHEQQVQINRLIEQGDGVINMPNGNYVLLNDPDKHLIPGRIGAFIAILGLSLAFGAFRISRTLKDLKQKVEISR